jgi:hypothetical protein
MFSVITNIYNKQTKRPTLMEFFTTTENWESFVLQLVQCVHHGWHDTHRPDIQVLTTHASTWMHRYSTLVQWSVPLRQRGHVQRWDVLCSSQHCHVHVSPRWTHRTSLVVQKTPQLFCGCEQFHSGRSFGFLVINICNHGERYETLHIMDVYTQYTHCISGKQALFNRQHVCCGYHCAAGLIAQVTTDH